MVSILELKYFLENYGESMAARVASDLSVVHDPVTEREEDIEKRLLILNKRLFPAQTEIVKACHKSFISGNKSVYLTAEMGSGKTLMAIAATHLLKEFKGIKRVLVICPPHLVPKWIKEIKDSLPEVEAHNLNGQDIITRLDKIKKLPRPVRLEFYVIGRERAKTGFQWKPCVIIRQDRHFCPKCGRELLDSDGCPIPILERNTRGRFKKRYTCKRKVLKWKYFPDVGKHQVVEETCGEQLWQADGANHRYRKVIPAKFIKERMKNYFSMLVADEVHQYKNESGQGYAFGVLASACKYVLCLTGTLAGGYSSDVYNLLFRTHPKLMIEDKNQWGNPKAFIERYGVLQKITTISEEHGLTTKARRRTIVKEKPGISPLLLGRMLLPRSVFLRLSDCMDHLQPYEEDVIELGMSPEMEDNYLEFEETLKIEVKRALASGDNSLLGAYLHALLSYPERIFTGVEVRHPHTKDLIACGPAVQGFMPKEIELLQIIRKELSKGRKVLVYYENTASTDISPRLIGMMEAESIKVKVLRSNDTEGRARIIDKWVDFGLEVLLTNPRKVETGMDLLDFPTVIFYQIPLSTYTLRQASRRSWRIPQTRPVKVFFLTYLGTMQTRLMKLMAEKLVTSLALEGELSDKGLSALSETSDSMARELARMLVDNSGSESDSQLKDIWADFRKKEVSAEAGILNSGFGENPKASVIEINESEDPNPELKKASIELERIGDRLVK